MFNSTNNVPYSVPVAPITGNSGGFGCGMWGDGSWIFLIILFALIFGWGNGGWCGYGGGQSTSVYEGYVLNNDFSQLSKQISDNYNITDRKFEGLANGICSLGYDQQAHINGINTNILTAQNGITNAITTNGYENRLGQQNIMTQMANCCCDLKQLNGETNYNIANQANMLDRTVSDKFCQTNFNMQTNTRDVIDSQTASTQAILARLDAMENARKDEKIAELTAKNFDLRLSASQEAQNNYLVSKLGYQCPKPAYVVQPPQTVSFPLGCNGTVNFNGGCVCGCA